MYAFFISLIGLVFTIFTFLWNIQFIIFKEDYFIFGNFFKKELCKIKYENMIVLTKRLDTIYFRPFKKIEETDKKKKEYISRFKLEKFLIIYENKDKFNVLKMKVSLCINFHYKNQIFIFHNKKIEEKLIEIQKQRGKKLDGTKIDDENAPSFIEEQVNKILSQKNNYKK